MRIPLLAVLVLLGPAAAPGAEPLRATLSTNLCTVGDPVRLTVAVDHAAGERVEPPDFSRGREITVRDLRRREEPREGGVRTVIEADLASFVVGRHVVSSGAVQVIRGTNTTALPFPPITLEVSSVLQGTNETVRAYRPPRAWPSRIPWGWIGGFAAVGALAALVAWLLARRKSRPPPVPPRTPAHEIALRDLGALKASGWIERGEVEPFFVEISRIVRDYLERRFGLRAPELTTEEFIRAAADSKALRSDHQALTNGFLEQSDLVKFARHRPGAPEMTAAWDAADRLVRETVPPPPEPKG